MPFLGAEMALGCAGASREGGLATLGAIWPTPPCHKPYIGPSIFSAAPSTLVGLTVYSPRTRFWTCPVAGLSVIRAEGLKANRPMLRYLRVEELAAFS